MDIMLADRGTSHALLWLMRSPLMLAIMSWTDGESGNCLLMKLSVYQFMACMITTAENFR